MAPLRKLGSTLPLLITESAGDLLARSAASGRPLAPEIQRALPDSRGGEEPKDLQRWRTDLGELFTTTLGQSVLFFAADQWVKIQLMLETPGPVAIGTRAEIVPVLSGKGRLLTTAVPYEVVLPKGTRLYYAAENVNRIAFTIEPIPWAEQLSMEIRRVAGSVVSSAREIAKAVAGTPADASLPMPLSTSLTRPTKLQRLTPMRTGRMF
jgi:hypothetical protein